jgi:hypothetical protein
MPSPRFIHGFENDVFLSYCHKDDETDPSGRRWVSKFESDLRTLLEQNSGRTVKIWRDQKLNAADRFDGEIHAQLIRSAMLLPIITRNYLNSEYCGKEWREFLSRASDLGNTTRMVKVAKTFVPLEDYPPEFRETNQHSFFVQELNGQYRQYHLHPDPRYEREYAAHVDDGAIPELGAGASVVRIQLEVAAGDRRNGNFPRLIWIQKDLKPAEPQQEALLKEIRETWARKPFEVLELLAHQFEEVLEERLNPQSKTARPPDFARRGPLGLVEAVEQRRFESGVNVLVISDQFEELFRYLRDSSKDPKLAALAEVEAAGYVKLLLEAAAQQDVSIYVVITMRSDFLGGCSRFHNLPERINKGLYLVPRMRRGQLDQAIVGPVHVAETAIEPRLVEPHLRIAWGLLPPRFAKSGPLMQRPGEPNQWIRSARKEFPS